MLKEIGQVSLRNHAHPNGEAIHETTVRTSGELWAVVARKHVTHDLPTKLKDELAVELKLSKEIRCRPAIGLKRSVVDGIGIEALGLKPVAAKDVIVERIHGEEIYADLGDITAGPVRSLKLMSKLMPKKPPVLIPGARPQRPRLRNHRIGNTV